MSIERLTENLNIIQMLSNRPVQNANDLKSEFDEAAGIIKDYLNNVVAPKIDAIEDIANEKIGSEKFQELKEKLEKEVEDKLTEIDKSLAEIEKVATSYEDFEITTESIAYSVTQSMEKDLIATYTKEGYKPLGIVGHYYTSVYGGNSNGAYVKNISDTSITVQGHISRGNTGGTTAGNLYVNILWMKIKAKITEETE